MCSAIIEINRKFKNDSEIDLYIRKLKTTLELFNLGSIQIGKREYTPNSILMTYSIPIDMEDRSHYKYEVSKTESSVLGKFIDFMYDFLPNSNWQNQENDLNSIYLSIERYLESVNKSTTADSKITTAITALEAILLKGRERAELSHRLSQRISYISRYFSEPTIKIYSKMLRAYEIRSTYIHGSMLPISERKDLGEIQDQVMKALRRTLLIFIELSKKTNKDKVISKIDNAIIDIKAHEKLMKEIAGLKLIKYTEKNIGKISTDNI